MHKIGYKAVLVYPEFDTQDTFWSYHKSLKMYAPRGEFGLPKRLLPPLGLMGLFNYLRPFYEQLVLIDKNIDPRPLRELIQDADHVFMGGMMAQQQSLLQLAAEVKHAGKILVVGGTAVIADSPLAGIADSLVENEAEGVIDQLLDDLGRGSLQPYYRGGYIDPEHFFQPDYSAINMENYVHMAVQISRGCPERCEFCDIPSRFGKAYRVTPWQNTRASFRQMTDLGWTGQVFVVDDNFIANPRKAVDVLKNLYRIGEEIGYHHPKYTELTLRLADETPIMAELRHWFRKAHFVNGFYGVETPNRAALLETCKHQNLRGDRTLVQKLTFISEQTGSGIMMGLIYGFDHDDNDTVDDFIAFVNASNAPVAMAGLLNALPCTPLMARMQREGRFFRPSSCNNSDGVINFVPNHFSVRQAELNYLRIIQGIYRPRAFFSRVHRHLGLIDPGMQHQYRNSNHDSLFYLSRILTRDNALIYWCFLPKTLYIAWKRFGFNSSGFWVILAEYFSLCGQYTHFAEQVARQRKSIAARRYERWQLSSWQLMKQAVKRQPLADQASFQLSSGQKNFQSAETLLPDAKP